jgi:cytochrome c
MKHMAICSIAFLLVTVSAAVAQDIDNGARLFRRCIACHTAEIDRNKFGPHLKGVVGRPAAGLTDYQYSEAMQSAGAAGLVWDEATLADFIANPKQKVPGTRMRFSGMAVGSDMDDLIGYLKANP